MIKSAKDIADRLQKMPRDKWEDMLNLWGDSIIEEIEEHVEYIGLGLTDAGKVEISNE